MDRIRKARGRASEDGFLMMEVGFAGRGAGAFHLEPIKWEVPVAARRRQEGSELESGTQTRGERRDVN